MVKHVIIWKLKEDVENVETIKRNIKENLEWLVGKIDGLLKMNIFIDRLSSSSGDIMMDSVFSSEEALKNYSENEKHVFVANTFVRPFTKIRLSYDFNED